MQETIRAPFAPSARRSRTAAVRAAVAVALASALFAAPLADADAAPGVTDAMIEQAVARGLVHDGSVPGGSIDVSVVDGVVTLSGRVDNLLARRQAVRVAGSYKGVRSVIDRISVDPIARPNDELRADVLAAIAVDPATEPYEVSVDVRGGIVTLSGTVQSWAERRLAESVAAGVNGVREIVNEISIDYALERSDEEIGAEIEKRLRLDPYVSSGFVEVAVDGGRVELTGRVGSANEKVHARNDAWVTGVDGVDADGLEVDWTIADELKRRTKVVMKSDGDIETAIEETFLFDPRILAAGIEVSVEDGIATLTGTVGSLSERNAAVRDAGNAAGVVEVVDRLRVMPEIRPGDSALARRVKAALDRDPVLESRGITVAARQSTVYLYGTVDTPRERRRAGDIAARPAGVMQVENKLDLAAEKDVTSDDRIRADIESELFWSWFVDDEDIEVRVEDGVATLSGTVDSWREFHAALDNAFEGGAVRVRSELMIRDERAYLDRHHRYDERFVR